MNPRWFARMALWARNPPSPQKVKFVLAVIAVCLLLYGVERIWGWPEWLTPERYPGMRVTR